MFDRGRELASKISANSDTENLQNSSLHEFTNDFLIPKMVILVKFYRVRAKNEFNRNSATYNL